ncbi:MAG: antibiotic biosynthesis monooxygenase [Bacteroides sp.]|nr:antibiotic biosynthesis monooxygenase [Bacteroides sp.]MCM1413911.1 antibiotic biosynthesis monooxygenase [Bacteroides sp.]
MIQLYCSMLVESSELYPEVLDTATRMVESSLREKGCINYDLMRSTISDDRFMIVETWATEKDLEAHQNSDHFKALVPRLRQLTTMTTERYNI